MGSCPVHEPRGSVQHWPVHEKSFYHHERLVSKEAAVSHAGKLDLAHPYLSTFTIRGTFTIRRGKLVLVISKRGACTRACTPSSHSFKFQCHCHEHGWTRFGHGWTRKNTVGHGLDTEKHGFRLRFSCFPTVHCATAFSWTRLDTVGTRFGEGPNTVWTRLEHGCNTMAWFFVSGGGCFGACDLVLQQHCVNRPCSWTRLDTLRFLLTMLGPACVCMVGLPYLSYLWFNASNGSIIPLKPHNPSNWQPPPKHFPASRQCSNNNRDFACWKRVCFCKSPF